MLERGVFVLSLDLELYWGVHEFATLAESRDSLLGERDAVVQLLDLFAEYELRATWAVVGLCCFDSREELLRSLPAQRPAYRERRLSPYEKLDALGADESEDPFHFGGSLVAQIRTTPGQEIATHTFSHYFALEPGQDAAAFEADIRAALDVARAHGDEIESIVFPRNQVNRGYLPICADLGLRAYRGTGSSRLQQTHAIGGISADRRAARLVDSFLPLSAHTAYDPGTVRSMPLADVPSSRFLRPYAPWRTAAEPLRIRRVTGELEHAARHALVYHLWWHPRNFAAHPARNLRALRKICERFVTLRRRFGMESQSMASVARQVAARRTEPARV